MLIDERISLEFEKVLRLPISIEEANRYKINLLRQHPGHSIINIQDLYRQSERQALSFTPSQVLRLWQKSNRLIELDKKFEKRQELSELLAAALIAEYLNGLYVLNTTPEIPKSAFQAALFNLQAVPKTNHLPDVYIVDRSPRNSIIPNLGYSENKLIEVLEYETYTYSTKSESMPLDVHLAQHLISKKINKRHKITGLFPYSHDTRLVMSIDPAINTSGVNFKNIAKILGPVIRNNSLMGIGVFADIFIVQFTNPSLLKGKVVKLYPNYERKIVHHNSFSAWITPDYVDPVFDK